MTATLPPHRKPAPPLESPADYPNILSEPLTLHAESYRYGHSTIRPFPGSNSGLSASSARAPIPYSDAVNTEPRSFYPSCQNTLALTSTHSIFAQPAVANVKEHGGSRNGKNVGSLDTPVPLPFPPNPPGRDLPNSASILHPADISPAIRVFSHSASDIGHAFRASIYPDPAFPASASGRPAILTSRHPARISSVGTTLSFSSDAPHAGPSSMEAVARSMTPRRKRLHKARPPTPPSVLGLLLNRALGSGESFVRHSRSNSAPTMSDRSYRPSRSFSDGSTKGPLSRQAPSSRSSGTTESGCTTSSWGSTSLSSMSSPITTPDSASSPGLSPRNSTRANKLQKKRPPLAPSAYLYPHTHAAALGRSKSTPNGLGQYSPRNRIWSSVEEARRAAEDADELGGQEPSYWYSSATESSSSKPSALGPIFELRKRRSSQVLSDLACTGLCSTSIAAHSSQLAVDTQPACALEIQSWNDPHADTFNPYTDRAPPADVAEASVADSRGNDAGLFASSVSPTPSITPADSRENTRASASGFAVVGGYLDRSEDAMRRWTLAMADVPDDVLMQHLERLRKESVALAHGRLPGRKSAAPSQVGHGDDDETYDPRDRRSSFCFGGPREMGISLRSASRARFSVGHDECDFDGEDSDDEALSDAEDEEDWKTARDVLFRCRELVQTERNYQTRLRELASTELSHHYASLVAKHIPALLRVSETLLAHVMDDPSVWGVSAAFIGCEEDLESALVAWAGIAGEFFIEDANLLPPKKLTKKFGDDTFSSHGHDHPSSTFGRVLRTRSQIGIAPSLHASVSARRFSSTMSDIGHGSNFVHDSAGMFTAALGTGLAFGLGGPPLPSAPTLDTDSPPLKHRKSTSIHGHGSVARVSSSLGLSRAVTAWRRKSMPSSMSYLPSLSTTSSPTPSHPRPSMSTPGHGHGHMPAPHHSTSSAHGHGSAPKRSSEQDTKMTVRDLAIQPVQRVMRYVLQYRDLVDHTPASSPSRALVERAYESALKIAKKCDRAQAHAAFFRQSTHTNTPSKSNKPGPRRKAGTT
ncbi:hypothetical protein LXA43DRAFT_286712 [Ganoderma leucocontextum]|nr:hypothetical protein LXA43DRAFT_286712 [Ganoderma leucocontextum]